MNWGITSELGESLSKLEYFCSLSLQSGEQVWGRAAFLNICSLLLSGDLHFLVLKTDTSYNNMRSIFVFKYFAFTFPLNDMRDLYGFGSSSDLYVKKSPPNLSV